MGTPQRILNNTLIKCFQKIPYQLSSGIRTGIELKGHRIMPGDSMARVEARVRAMVARAGVRVGRLEGGFEPSPVSRVDSWGFAALARSVREVFPDAVVAPYLTVGATDARHLTPVADDVVRFSPLRATSQDLERIHGIDERVATAAHADAIRFYRRLILNSAGEAREAGSR